MPLVMTPRNQRQCTDLTEPGPLSWCDDGGMRLWNNDGSLFNELSGHLGRIEGVAILDDGRIISWGAEDFSLCLWSGTGKRLQVNTIPNALEEHPEWAAYLYPKQVSANRRLRLKNKDTYCCLSASDKINERLETRWYAGTNITEHKVFDNGHAIVSLDSGQISHLRRM